MRKICVIGLGYIGLPTASMFATHGYKVIGIDISTNIVETINKGASHIEEPGLNTLVKAAVLSKNLIARKKQEKADVFIICVPTPLDSNSKKANLEYVKSAVESIVPYLERGNLVILESTVTPGTTKNILVPILEQSDLKVGKDVFLAHCPERVLPGKVLKELVENDRIIGGFNAESAEQAKKLYQCFVAGEIYLTDATTAEMIKLMENTYRDVNIALSNEFSKIGEKLNINVWDAIRLANRHPRVNIHQPGPGVGGHCIPIDPWFIIEKAPENAQLIILSRKINEEMIQHVITITEGLIESIKGKTITIFGVAYKGNVDDIRETPAERLYELLLTMGGDIRLYDQHVQKFKYELQNLEKSVENSSCIIVMTDHDEFKNMDEKEIINIGNLMKSKNVVDTRNCLEHDLWNSTGFRVRILGNTAEQFD